MRTVVITGANGFLGSHVVKALVAQGYSPTLLQRSPITPLPDLELVRVSQLTFDDVRRALAGRRFDWVVHLAAYGVDPAHREIEPMLRVNIDVGRALVLLASTWGSRAMVIAGSGSEYRLLGSREPVGEDHPVELKRLYGASKAAGSIIASGLANHLGLPVAVGRLFGIYGPGEAPHRLLPSLVRGLLARKRVPLSAGLQSRDFLYVADAVEAILALLLDLDHVGGQHVFNISTGQPVSVRCFAEATADALGADRNLLGFGDLPMRPDDVQCLSGDPSKLNAFNGWRPKTALTSGISECIRAHIVER